MLFEELPAREARLFSPLKLAYLGDAAWSLMVRARLLPTGERPHALHELACGRVCAGAQQRAFAAIEALLSEEERDVLSRGRNAKPRHAAPKHQDPMDYACATGLEALFGFLCLTGREARLRELFDIAWRAQEDAAASPEPQKEARRWQRVR